MKKPFTIIAAVVLTASVFAQAPQKMSYQAVIRNNSNALITSTPIGMQISVLQGSPIGTVVYVETQTPTTNSNGLVNIEIGGGTGFNTINWANGPYFIKTETDPIGGINYSISGTSQLLSVPYALHSKTAETLSGTITETDPIFGAWNKSTGISITASQISDFQTSVTNNTEMLANTAKNSYPSADSTKLAGIEAGAEVNVNADWNATSGDAQILNKPTIPVGTNTGDMQYWNGTVWIMIPVGQPGQFLQLTASNIPSWLGATYPVLTTTAASSIAQSTVTIGGNVTTDGGSTVTARGVCWSTTANPTIANSITSDGTGTGSFISSITGLTPNTIYYVRAYATNSVGIGYGNELSFTTAALVTIGESFQGGVVGYILQVGDAGYNASEQHGIIIAPSDQSTGAAWGCSGTLISGAAGIAVGTGNQNTIDIVTGCTTAGIATEICYNLVLGGYSDWYLPSKGELSVLYANEGILHFSPQNYWCSTQYDANNGWKLNFGNGNWSSNSGKVGLRYVRAVRSF